MMITSAGCAAQSIDLGACFLVEVDFFSDLFEGFFFSEDDEFAYFQYRVVFYGFFRTEGH